MINTECSDLFFNHCHANYNGLYTNTLSGDDSFTPTYEDITEAIEEDARQFVSNYPELCQFYEISADNLADDFMYRL